MSVCPTVIFYEMRRKSEMKGRRLVKRCFESLEGAQKGVEFLFLIPEFETPFFVLPKMANYSLTFLDAQLPFFVIVLLY